jgi:putative transposase
LPQAEEINPRGTLVGQTPEVTMPRQARFIESGVPLHVVQRGVDRQTCFRADSDFQRYWELLGEHARRNGCDIHAYVLMTNHVHLLLTPRGMCGSLMKSLGQQYAQYFNRRYQRTGPLWESRYRAHVVQDDAHLLTCQRYIELNPVRAGMCGNAGAYRWSSYRSNAEGSRDDVVTPHGLFVALDPVPEGRRKCYRELFSIAIAPAYIDAIRASTVSGRPFGNRELSQQGTVPRS